MILNILAWAILILAALAIVVLCVVATIMDPVLCFFWGAVVVAAAIAWALNRVSS